MRQLSSRITLFAAVGALLLSVPRPAAAQEVTLIAGGDIEWSRITKPPDVYFENPDPEEGEWISVPYLNTERSRQYLEETYDRDLVTQESHHIRALDYNLEFETPMEMARYPFRNIAPVLREADIAFANLETPLSDDGRYAGAFRTPPVFAEGLRWAGIDVVSIANNHALDAGGQGLFDTMESLWRAGVGYTGGGANLAEARRPFIIERNGIEIAFFAYAQFVNEGSSSFAQPNRSGVMPLDPFLIEEDIRRVRDRVDYVVVSFHWAIENSQETHPAARAFAHDIIDAGADVILGHHPHVPRGVEVYRGGVIFYSLGNFIFGHNHTYWMDNYLARLTLTPERITQVEIIPIAGEGNNLSQPYVLQGEEARELLEDVRMRTAALDTQMEIRGDIGLIYPETRVSRR